MEKNKIITAIKQRNKGDFSKMWDLYLHYVEVGKPELARNILMELFLNDDLLEDNLCFQTLVKSVEDANLKYANYFYLLAYKNYSWTKDPKVMNEDKLKEKFISLTESKTKQPKYYFKGTNNKKYEKINSIIETSKKIMKPEKKEKLLVKALKYDDPKIMCELAMFYEQNNMLDLALAQYKDAMKKGYYNASMRLADYYHSKNDLNNEIDCLFKSLIDYYFNKEGIAIATIRLLNIYLNNNKPLDKIYPYLVWGLLGYYRVQYDVAYHLAGLYEKGIFVERDAMSAYLLYSCCGDYEDSLAKIKELGEELKSIFKSLVDQELDVEYSQIIAEEEEKKDRLKSKKQEIELLNSSYPNVSIVLDEDIDDVIPKRISDREYNKKCNLYKKALKEKEPYKLIPALEKAADGEHTKAMMALYEIYKNYDIEIAFKWLDCAIRFGNLSVSKKSEEYIELKTKVDKEKKERAEAEKNRLDAIEKEQTKKEYEEYTNDLSKFESLFIKANNNNSYALSLIVKHFCYKKLSNDLTDVLIKLSQQDNQYAQYFLYNYYIKQNMANDAISFLQSMCDMGSVHLLLKITKYNSFIERAKKEPYNELYAQIIDILDKIDTDNEQIRCYYGRLLEQVDIAKKYNYKYDSKKFFDIFLSLENAKDAEVARYSWKSLASSYYYGIGTEKDIEKAAYYYNKTDNPRGKEIENKLKIQKHYEYKKAVINKYSHPKFEEFKITHKELAERVESVYLKGVYVGDLENELKARNELIDKGVPLSEIYAEVFYVKEYLKRKALKEEQQRQAELKRQVELKAAEEKRQAELRAIEEKRQAELKLAQQNKSATISAGNTSASCAKPVLKKVSMPYKADFNKDLYERHLAELDPPIGYNRIIYDECVKIAKLRASYNCPIKTFGGKVNKEYKTKYAQYINDLEAYKKRLFELENPIGEKYNAYRRRVWELSDDSEIMYIRTFINNCKEIYKRKTTYDISITPKKYVFVDRENKKLDEQLLVERMLCYLPIYAKEITLDINAQVFYKTVISREYSDLYEEFDNSEYSKMMTWDEFSHKSGYAGDIWQASVNDREAQSNANFKVREQNEKLIKSIVNDMFDKCELFVGQNCTDNGQKQYVEGNVKSVKFDISFYGK